VIRLAGAAGFEPANAGTKNRPPILWPTENDMEASGRSAPAQSAEAVRADGRRRHRLARLYDLPQGVPHEAARHEPVKRLIGEIKRRTDVVGIFPNGVAIIGLAGAILLGQDDEWAVQRALYMTLKTVCQLSDDPLITLPPLAV